MDNVNHPAHYEKNSLDVSFEPFDWLQGFSFALGNALKYLVRYKDKGHPKEDLEKARWYLTHMNLDYCHGNNTPVFNTLFYMLKKKYNWMSILFPNDNVNTSYITEENIKKLVDHIDTLIIGLTDHNQEEPEEEKKDRNRDKEYYLIKAKDLVYATTNSCLSDLKKLNKHLEEKDLVDEDHNMNIIINDINNYTSKLINELNYLLNNKNSEPDADMSLALSKYIFTLTITTGSIKKFIQPMLNEDSYEFIETFSQKQLGHKFVNLFSKAYPDIDFQTKTVSLDDLTDD